MDADNEHGIGLTIEPDGFDEAMEEFLARHIITGSEAAKLEDYAKRRAWWIAGVAQMDVVFDAHSALEKAMENGTPFEEWQKEVEEKLTNAWGRPNSHRVLTIFRNATMQAANAGRWEQMHQPHVLAARPYLEHDGVRDSRECEICKACNGIILPADHPWWETMSPILHHCCRCGLRSHRTSVAEERGITTELPDVRADKGFGYQPTTDDSLPPKPWDRDPPPPVELEMSFAEKTSEHELEVEHAEVAIKPEHDPEYWEGQYRERYGDAAKQVAFGRALFEKSKDLTDEEMADGLRELREAWFPGVYRYSGELDERIHAAEIAAAKLLVFHTRANGVRHVPKMAPPAGCSDEIRDAVERAQIFWSRMLDPSLVAPDRAWRLAEEDRSYYSSSERCVYLARDLAQYNVENDTAAHEYGHAIEMRSGRAAICHEFIRARDENFERLDYIFPGDGYTSDEVCRRDQLWHAYAGKVYFFANGEEDHGTSEVISTMSGHIADGKLPEILRDDPDSVYFFFGWIMGVV